MGTPRYHVVYLLALTCAFLPVRLARADLIIFDNNGDLQNFINANPPLTRENVLFNGPNDNTGPGTSLTGHTNKTNILIDFTSSESIFNQGIGQANIEAVDGSYQDLIIGPLNPANPGTFTVAAFSYDPINKQDFPANLTIVVTEADDTQTAYNFTIEDGKNVFFGIVAVNGQSIKSIAISGDVDLERVRQVDIGFGTVHVPIPEPAALALLGLGGIIVAGGAYVRRRKAKRLN